MIAGYLRNNQLGAYLLLPVMAGLLWIPAFSNHTTPVFEAMPLFSAVLKLFGTSVIAQKITAVILIVGEAFLLNHLIVSHQATPKPNFLPAGIYILLMTSSGSFLTLHPLIFANLFLLLALSSLFSMHRKETAFANAFDAGFFIGIASLFYLPSILFYFLLYLSFLIMRPFIWREWIISLMGVIVPYVFAAFIFFLKGDLLSLWENRVPFTFEGKISKVRIPSSNYFFVSLFGIFTGLALLNLFSSITSLSLKARSTTYVLFWFLVFATLIIIASPRFQAPYTAFLFIPASVFIGNFLLQLKKNWFRELCFVSLLAAVLYNILLR